MSAAAAAASPRPRRPRAFRQLSNKSSNDVHVNLIQNSALHMVPDERPLQGLQHVKIIVLGAQGVGKTSVVEQFVNNVFNEYYPPTRQRKCHYTSVFINNHLYEVKIVDCPPVCSLATTQWSADFLGYGLLSASAYILIFDITNEESLQYVRAMREQILEHRGGAGDKQLHEAPPIIVAGNKHDLPEPSHLGKKEIASMVKKQWKCPYIECSAKWNWHIVSIFKESMKAIDLIDYTQYRQAGDRNRPNGQRGCSIL